MNHGHACPTVSRNEELRLRGLVLLGLLLCASGLAACSLINPFDEVKTTTDTGGTGGATATGGIGGTATVPHEDDCLDGADNDGDGDIDCADDDCQPDHECVVAPVVGWKGPLHVSVSPYDPAAPAPSLCPDGKLPATYYASPSPAECAPCDCTFAGALCAAPVLLFNQYECDVSPNGTWETKVDTDNTACVDLSSPDTGPCYYVLSNDLPDILDPGTCTTTGGELTNPLPWGKRVDVCAAPQGGGCKGDRVCVHKAPSGFDEAVCMTQDGDLSCPPGWLDRDLEVYGGGTDTRSCDGCFCSVDKVFCVGGSHTLNVGSGCQPPPGQGTTVEILTNLTCTSTFDLAVKGAFSLSAKPHRATPSGFDCGVTVSSGSVEPAGNAKICCRQLGP